MKRESARVERRSKRAEGGHRPGVWRKSCYAIEINDRPVLALTATSPRAAQARLRETWFIEELARMRSSGRPILRPNDELVVRPARPEEVSALELQRGLDEARREDTKYCFAFLIPIDAELN